MHTGLRSQWVLLSWGNWNVEIVVWSKSGYILKGQNSNIIGLAKSLSVSSEKTQMNFLASPIYVMKRNVIRRHFFRFFPLQSCLFSLLPLLLLSLPSPLLFCIRLFIWNVFWITMAENLKTLGDIKCCWLMGTSGWSDFKSTNFSSRHTTALIGDILLLCRHCNAE